MSGGGNRWTDTILRLLGVVLAKGYEVLFGWLDNRLALKNENKLVQDIQDAMPFLFDEYGGRIVPNQGVPFPPSFDYAFVTIAVENLLIRFCRGRGELDVGITSAESPTELRELGKLLDALDDNQSPKYSNMVDLWEAARLLRPEIERLIRGFRADRIQDLKRNLSEADTRARVAVLMSGMGELWVTSSEEQTIQIGRELARVLPKKACVLLIGNLGAGKTTLAKGIIDGLGFAQPDNVVSPTYTLIHEYGDGRVYHIDLYRLEKPEQVATLGLDDIFDREAVVLIEWGERFPALMPRPRIEIRLTAVSDFDRQIEIINIL